MPKMGCITPSRFKDMMSSGRGKDESFGLTAKRYAMELAMNRVCGVTTPDLEGIKAIDHGNAYEIYAIEAYELVTISTTIKPVEPIVHPEYDYIAGIPDLLVDNDGIAEVKCPFNPLNHVGNIIGANQYESLYKYQMQGYLWITDRLWIDFVSFSDEFTDEYKLSVHRFQRDNDVIDQLEARCIEFEVLISEYCDMIRQAATTRKM